MKPRLTTIVSTISYLEGIPINEYADCPECGEHCIATYINPDGKLKVIHSCQHFSDLCSTGGNGVGFMFWVGKQDER